MCVWGVCVCMCACVGVMRNCVTLHLKSWTWLYVLEINLWTGGWSRRILMYWEEGSRRENPVLMTGILK